MKSTPIPIEISARHVHLTAEDWTVLFGASPMTVGHDISQKPQFAAAERVTLRGPKGVLENMAIVGPVRPYTQVELALTDARRLGLTPPLSDSGSLAEAATITISGPQGSIDRAAAIIQKRHLHLSPDEAAVDGLSATQEVSIQIDGPRGARLDHVLVRVHESFSRHLHLDTDEANACGVATGMTASLL